MWRECIPHAETPAFKDHIATTDALAVSRLRKAGANIFGKTNVPLDLADFQSYNAIYGTTNNPWDIGRTPRGVFGRLRSGNGRGVIGH